MDAPFLAPTATADARTTASDTRLPIKTVGAVDADNFISVCRIQQHHGPVTINYFNKRTGKYAATIIIEKQVIETEISMYKHN